MKRKSMRKIRRSALLTVLVLLLIGLVPTMASATPPVPVIIEPTVSLVSDQNLIFDTVTILVAEDNGATDIISTLFEYYDGVSWQTIGIDTNGSEPSYSPVGGGGTGDGWSIQWDTVGLPEGTYSLRATMVNNLNESGQALVDAYLDPTPPIPTIVKPALTDHEATVSGVVTIEATTTDEDVSSFTVEVKLVAEPYVKGLEKKDQHDYVYGNTGCVPTSWASSLQYLAHDYPTPGANRYPDLTKEGGKELNQTELVKKLGEYMKTNGGTYISNWVNGLKKWVKDHGNYNLKVRKWDNPTYWDYKRELKNSEDVTIGALKVTKDGDNHMMAGNSVSNKKNADGTYDVDFMDPWRGEIINTKMYPNGTFQYELKTGPPFTKWVTPGPLTTLSPAQDEQPGWSKIGTDTDDSDGWSVTWDTSCNPSCTYYLVRGIMKDAKGNEAKTYIIIHILEPVGGTIVPVNKLALFKPYISALAIMFAIAAYAIRPGARARSNRDRTGNQRRLRKV